jgi:hypothetical protein
MRVAQWGVNNFLSDGPERAEVENVIYAEVEPPPYQATPQAVEDRADNQQQPNKQSKTASPQEKSAALVDSQHRQDKTSDDENSEMQHTHEADIQQALSRKGAPRMGLKSVHARMRVVSQL